MEVFTGGVQRSRGDRGVWGMAGEPVVRRFLSRHPRWRVKNGLTGRLQMCNVPLMPKSTRVDDVGPSGTEPVGSAAVSRRKHA